ncbi:MAG: DUF3179 domain-containing protein [Proteobacteria bacterium]|nr:DUF3179 domain-containing protein [Pseudomonadota bacterium]
MNLIKLFSITGVLTFLISTYTLYASAPIGYQAVPRDGFPVFDNPRMLDVASAEQEEFIYDRDSVIGVVHGDEAKAYPVTVMGVHELGNDWIDGIPIAIGW